MPYVWQRVSLVNEDAKCRARVKNFLNIHFQGKLCYLETYELKAFVTPMMKIINKKFEKARLSSLVANNVGKCFLFYPVIRVFEARALDQNI